MNTTPRSLTETTPTLSTHRILTGVGSDHADIYRPERAEVLYSLQAYPRTAAWLPAGTTTRSSIAVTTARVRSDAAARSNGRPHRQHGHCKQSDDLYVLRNGAPYGTFSSPMVGEHNLYNQVAIVAALDFNGFTADELSEGFPTFKGIRRRQEIVGTVSEITVIDDFAHHPTAIDVTLSALKLRFGGRRMWAIFEPRSATSRRNTFQHEFAQSFSAADIVVIAPPHNRDALGDEALDVDLLISELRDRQTEAYCWGDAPDATAHWSPKEMAATIARAVIANAMPGDVIAVLSNGGFGGIHKQLLEEITLQLG